MKKLKITFEDQQPKNKKKYKSYPRLDCNALAFESEEHLEKMQVENIKKIKFKVLRRFLLPTVIFFVVAIAILSYISILNYQNQSVMHDKGYDDGYSAGYDAGYDEGYNSGYDDGYDEGYDDGYDSGNSNTSKQSISNTRYANSSNIFSNNVRTCTVPDCNNRANTGSYYCFTHECSSSGCHEQRISDVCRYCEKHKCDMPGCNNAKSLNSYYCIMHS